MSADQERYEELINQAVDDQLDPTERSEFDALIASNPEWKSEFDDFLAIKKSTDAMTQRIMATAQALPPRPSRAVESGLRVSFGLIFAGLLGAAGVETYFFFMAPTVPLLGKVVGGLIGAGVSGLLAYVVKTRLSELKNDPYQEIDR